MKLLLFATIINPESFAGQRVLSKGKAEEPWRQKKEQVNNFISCSAIHIIRWRNRDIHENKSCTVHGRFSWFHLLHLLHLCCWGDPRCFSFHLVRWQIERWNIMCEHEQRTQCKVDHNHFLVIVRGTQHYLVLTSPPNQNQNRPGHILIPPSHQEGQRTKFMKKRE